MENDSSYRIRKMREADIPQVLEIDHDAFPSQWPHPTVNSYHHELRNKLAHYMVIYVDNPSVAQPVKQSETGLRGALDYLGRIFDQVLFPRSRNSHSGAEFLAGMAGIWMMVDEAHIVTIAVRNAHRQCGLGEWLLVSIIELATQLNARYVTLEVRITNAVAQALYEKYGFSRAGIRKKYYSDNGEDALIMTTSDLTLPSYKAMFQKLKQEHLTRWSRCLASA